MFDCRNWLLIITWWFNWSYPTSGNAFTEPDFKRYMYTSVTDGRFAFGWWEIELNCQLNLIISIIYKRRLPNSRNSSGLLAAFIGSLHDAFRYLVESTWPQLVLNLHAQFQLPRTPLDDAHKSSMTVCTCRIYSLMVPLRFSNRKEEPILTKRMKVDF